ncbi:MAG: DUF309 domain-containing protein [Phycisphaerae bacterium]|nr:DUF309 domain-containing protein [Phycisphaerae bacterium]
MPPVEVNTLHFAAKRFTDTPFPPYRFIPGRHPHPIAHPQGHSHRPPGQPEPSVEPVPPERWPQSQPYLFGCDLYNHGFWWESHEAWEGLWRVVPADSARRRYLQGIIQIAAIHLQLFQGHAEGVARLRITSREHLAAAAAAQGQQLPFMGIDILELQRRIDDYCERVLDAKMPPPWHLPRFFPYIIPSERFP